MARTRQNFRLNTRTSRATLQQRTEPYWASVAKGLTVGYYKGRNGGTWTAKHYSVETGKRKQALGIADDHIDADGLTVLSFHQAQAAAREWFKRKTHEDAGQVVSGPYTVANAMDDYMADRERVRRKPLDRTRSVIETHIRPILGHIELSRLTHGKVKIWRDRVAESAPRVRNKPDITKSVRQVDMDDADVLRKRQATANRILTVLKAALNHAYKESRVATKAAWEKVTPFREVDVPKVQYLSIPECKRLIGACPQDFRALVRAALYTGCRYGELAALTVEDFNDDSDSIHIRQSKSGKPRHIPLTKEGADFFHSVVANRAGDEPMFTHSDGRRKDTAWEHSQQRYWMELACKDAKIMPAISFHILRHTYASQLAMNGAPMPVIAALLGHADTRMTEKHYGHLSPTYVAQTLRANLPSFGFEAYPKKWLASAQESDLA
jgi:integrase